MKKTVRKLTLSRETLYGLDIARLQQAAGGVSGFCYPPDTNYPCRSVDVCGTSNCSRTVGCTYACPQ
ncbi:MAG TPA: hypothetical protein VGH73_14210 [Thermoanaerobaculia bacterium]|jgi:hypothetical protein